MDPRRSSLTGTVTGTRTPLEMPVLQPCWFIFAAAALMLEGIPPLSRAIMAVTAGGVAVTAILVHLAARLVPHPLTARFALVRRRTGLRLHVTDDTGALWTLHFLPWLPHDLHPGDPAFAEGRQTADREFRALTLTNIRTGNRHLSRHAMAWLTAATCLVLVALLLATPIA
ncbi:hypothetical protein LTV02_36695 [Nocardia yamanashiensis]|uniref:hypothetical protein n=1 Tax=Nocardia yamanashiensis TaxID=209247 RepID=UPI001E5B1DE9|nr:hypothetical protein [Nocardia yamanashiensis]UGT41408.1 hypothetical protein LTV02_36695 [Nocardia yamanashiensis]